MKMRRFVAICSEVLASKGLQIGMSDLPDVDFGNYFDENMDESEAREAAEELILCEADNLGIPEELLDF